MSAALPPVSYVIPVLNEAVLLPEAVASVLGQNYPAEQEVVVALGSSTDGTNEVAARLAAADPRVRLVDNPSNDVPIGLNRAIRASRHPIVVRVDAHAVLPKDYTRRLVTLLQETGAANVGGVMRAVGSTPFQQAVARVYNSPWGLGGGQFHGATEAGPSETAYLGVFRREVLEEVGLFDEGMRRAQDWELNSRIIAAGHLIWFTPDVEVEYRPRSTPAKLARQMLATGVWRGHLVRKQGRTPLKYLAPPAVVLALGVSRPSRRSPAPPPSGAAQTDVGPARLTPRGRVQHVAPVHLQPARHQSRGRVRVELPVLLPLGQQHDSVGAGQRILHPLGVGQLGVFLPRVLDRLRVGANHVRAEPVQLHRHVQGR